MKICSLHLVPANFKEPGVSKKTGKPYPGFWSCNIMDNGQYCSATIIDDPRPEVNQAPQAIPQTVGNMSDDEISKVVNQVGSMEEHIKMPEITRESVDRHAIEQEEIIRSITNQQEIAKAKDRQFIAQTAANAAAELVASQVGMGEKLDILVKWEEYMDKIYDKITKYKETDSPF